MPKYKAAKKCQRGQKICLNPACQRQIPINMHVCRLCGYMNKTNKNLGQKRENIKEKIRKVSRFSELNSRDLSHAKSLLSKELFEVCYTADNRPVTSCRLWLRRRADF